MFIILVIAVKKLMLPAYKVRITVFTELMQKEMRHSEGKHHLKAKLEF